jgi:hypothetical protein
MAKPKFLFFFAAAAILFVAASSAHAQSASAVFSGPQNMDPGLQSGLNNLTGYVAFLPPDANML